MNSPYQETIFALASPPGRGGVAVIRVSGPGARQSLLALAGLKNLSPRRAYLKKITDPVTGAILDHALVIFFEGPASYTGEDTAEYYLHGGRAVVESVLATLGKQDHHRLAHPGEFTRRAFENGKLDLTEAEAVADLIDAETQAQRIQALGQMEGNLSRLYTGWADFLKTQLAHLEADLEFPDEDLPGGIAPTVKPKLNEILSAIAAHLNDNRRGERLRDGIHIAVIGAPNAGKSSLVNALAQRDVAIVSDMPGTTRDIIEAHLDIGGYPVILSDTAGLRPEQIGAGGHDKIESEGMRRALDRARRADLIILLFDGASAVSDAHTLALIDPRAIIAVNKSDCPHDTARTHFPAEALYVSAHTGAGLGQLNTRLLERIKNLIGAPEAASLTRARHRAALEEALINLERAQHTKLPELMAEDVRLAVRAIGRITGRVDVEDLLDVIFRDFCIGK